MRNSTADHSPDSRADAPDSRPADAKRRRFLFTLGAGSASAAVVAAGALPGTATAEVAAGPASDQDAPYRVTGHVRDYYRTAKI